MRTRIGLELLWLVLLAGGPVWAQTPSVTIEPTKENPRNSEGDIIALKDGRLCLIYSRFTGGGEDDAAADLALRTSADDGATWSGDRIVVRGSGGLNVMSVSLLRLATGEIALFYLRKASAEDCRPRMRLSTDEARTWSAPTVCIPDAVGYYVLNNDRAVQLRSGRLLLPVARHRSPGGPWDSAGTIMCHLSDDAGKTWSRSEVIEADPAGWYCYTSLTFVKDRMLLAYCAGDRKIGGLNRLKIVVLSRDWLLSRFPER